MLFGNGNGVRQGVPPGTDIATAHRVVIRRLPGYDKFDLTRSNAHLPARLNRLDGYLFGRVPFATELKNKQSFNRTLLNYFVTYCFSTNPYGYVLP